MKKVIIYLLRRLIKIFEPGKHILLIGAGEAGRELIVDFFKAGRFAEIYGILDDDQSKHGEKIHGVPVVGSIDRLPKLCETLTVNEVIISIKQLSADRLHFIIDSLDLKTIKVRIIAAKNERVTEKSLTATVREILAEDLLGREPASVDHDLICENFSGKTVFITGAGGSIGSEIVRQMLKYPVKSVICLCRSEYSLYKLQEEMRKEILLNKPPSEKIIYLIGNIKDTGRLEEVFKKYRPDYIFHAAAHKHVPYMEEFVKEAWKNNVIGTLNLLYTASKFSPERFVLISTDKAVHPVNIMGATKRISEKLCREISHDTGMKASVVRFGNVLGSRGSVVPLFKKQILAGGPVTVTHPDVVRYFMTIAEAALLVINCAAMSFFGGTYILDMGKPVKISDLVKKMLKLYGYEPEKDIKIVYTGLRPGEKLNEELLVTGENINPTSNSKIFCLRDDADLDSSDKILEKVREFHYEIDSRSDKDVKDFIKKLLSEYNT